MRRLRYRVVLKYLGGQQLFKLWRRHLLSCCRFNIVRQLCCRRLLDRRRRHSLDRLQQLRHRNLHVCCGIDVMHQLPYRRLLDNIGCRILNHVH